jgi:hypothetical protein
MRVVVDLKTRTVTEDHAFVPPPAPPLTLAQYEQAIQAHVDGAAQSRGYRDGAALVGYANSTVSAWAAEAATFIGWRDAVWIYAFAELGKVQSGERPQPSIDDLVAELAVISWPS